MVHRGTGVQLATTQQRFPAITECTLQMGWPQVSSAALKTIFTRTGTCLFCRVAEDVQIVASDQEVIQALGALLQVISNDAIAARGKFTVGVSGGSLISFLTKCLPKLNTDFTKWVLAFCDERVVPFDDCESTYGTYRKAFCDSGLLKPDQFIAIDPNLNGKASKKMQDRQTHEFKNWARSTAFSWGVVAFLKSSYDVENFPQGNCILFSARCCQRLC